MSVVAIVGWRRIRPNRPKNGWNIKSVIATPCKEWDYPNYFASTLFTIVAEYEDEDNK